MTDEPRIEEQSEQVPEEGPLIPRQLLGDVVDRGSLSMHAIRHANAGMPAPVRVGYGPAAL